MPAAPGVVSPCSEVAGKTREMEVGVRHTDPAGAQCLTRASPGKLVNEHSEQTGWHLPAVMGNQCRGFTPHPFHFHGRTFRLLRAGGGGLGIADWVPGPSLLPGGMGGVDRPQPPLGMGALLVVENGRGRRAGIGYGGIRSTARSGRSIKEKPRILSFSV